MLDHHKIRFELLKMQTVSFKVRFKITYKSSATHRRSFGCNLQYKHIAYHYQKTEQKLVNAAPPPPPIPFHQTRMKKVLCFHIVRKTAGKIKGC